MPVPIQSGGEGTARRPGAKLRFGIRALPTGFVQRSIDSASPDNCLRELSGGAQHEHEEAQE